MQNQTATKLPKAGRWAPLVATLFTVGIFVGAIFLVNGQIRLRLHEGYLSKDGEALSAAVSALEKKAKDEGIDLSSPNEQKLVLLDASDIRDMTWGIRLFDAEGKFLLAVPKEFKPYNLRPSELARVRNKQTASTLEREMKYASQFLDSGTKGIQVGKSIDVGPSLSVVVPTSNGAAQFLLDGERVLAQLSLVDQDVRRYTMSVGIVGSAVIGLALIWAFWRLKHANTLLQKRTADLLRANHELTLAAKTSAVGAVAAHLIHGLKNPLFGLQMFVSHKMENKDEGTQLEWRAAADAAHRMQMMIADIVRILREDTGEAYEVTVPEVVSILEGKITAMAREKSVQFATTTKCNGKLGNREGNLVILALTNLIQNAIQASKEGAKVTLEVYRNADVFCFDVSDEAGGIPKKMRDKLFTPCASTKPGGTGLGLAITKQLANHMGGQLEMVKTNEIGTTFRLSIPQALFQAPTGAEAKLTNAMA